MCVVLQIASYFLIQILIRHDASKWIRKHRNAASFIIKRTYANWRQKKYKGVKKERQQETYFWHEIVKLSQFSKF